jgi:hypothetical protein
LIIIPADQMRFPQQAERLTQLMTGHGITRPMLKKPDWERSEPTQVIRRKDAKET